MMKSPEPSTALDNSIAQADLVFALRLFGEIHQHRGDKNIFISPLSIALILAILYNGAQGGTARAIAETLAISETDLDRLNERFRALIESFTTLSPAVELTIASSLWLHTEFQFEPQFHTHISTNYQAELAQLDFTRPGATATINRWVATQTNGKIREIIDGLNPQSMMILLNAVYFKGEWQQQFDQARTTEGIFALPNGQAISAPMMLQSGEFHCYRDKRLEAICLPYRDSSLALYLLLPQIEIDIADFCQQHLTLANWQSWFNQINQTPPIDLFLMMPRCQLEYEVDLVSPLSMLGMGEVFDSDRADFHAMLLESKSRFAVSKIKHKSYLEINETGTVAAAVTAATLARGLPGTMIVDRPFVVVIADRKCGAVLFIGAIVTPNNNGYLSKDELERLSKAQPPELKLFFNFKPSWQIYRDRLAREQTREQARESSTDEFDNVDDERSLLEQADEIPLIVIKELTASIVVMLLSLITGLYLGGNIGRYFGNIISQYLSELTHWQLTNTTVIVMSITSTLVGSIAIVLGFILFRFCIFCYHFARQRPMPSIDQLQEQATRLLYIIILILIGEVIGALFGWLVGIAIGRWFNSALLGELTQFTGMLLGGILLPPLSDTEQQQQPSSPETNL